MALRPLQWQGTAKKAVSNGTADLQAQGQCTQSNQGAALSKNQKKKLLKMQQISEKKAKHDKATGLA